MAIVTPLSFSSGALSIVSKALKSAIDSLDLSVNVNIEQVEPESKGMFGNLAGMLGKLSGIGTETNENLETMNQQQDDQFGFLQQNAAEQEFRDDVNDSLIQRVEVVNWPEGGVSGGGALTELLDPYVKDLIGVEVDKKLFNKLFILFDEK